MSEDDPQIPFQPPQSPHHFGLPPKPHSSPLGLTIGILIILAILIGGGGIIYVLIQRTQPAAAPPPPASVTQSKPPPMAPKVQPLAVPWPATTPTAVAKSSPTSAGVQPPPKSNDPTTPEWERVEQVYRTSPPELAVIALQDFLANSPTSTFASTAQSQIVECLDRLWWLRIQSLCKQRDEMNRKIADADQQLARVKANSPDPQRVKELEAEREPFAKQLEAIQGHLDEMKYAGTVTPDLYDEAMLAELRKSRDAATYEAWQKKTANYIKRNRGKLPW
jgi:hypothetical protein